MRIEELNDVPLRVIYEDDGSVRDIVDQRGNSFGFLLGRSHPVTGVSRISDINVGRPAYRVLALGTSITNKWGDGFYGAVGDYSNVAHKVDSYLFWMFVDLGWPVVSLINAGVSGNTTDQMVARHATDVAAKYDQFDTLVFEPGPNDYPAAITLEKIKENISFVVRDALENGKEVILLTPTPTEFATTTEQRTKYKQVVAWIKSTYKGVDGVVVNDPAKVFADPTTGSPLSVMYVPTATEATRVHPSISGAQAMGRVAAENPCNIKNAVRVRYVDSSRFANEYLPNPRLSGSSAAGSDNFQIAGTNVTAASGGPFACGFSILQGSFTSAAIAPLTVTGSDLRSGGGVKITVAGAGANFDRLRLRVGSSDATAGLSQVSRWDQTRANTTAYKLGDHARLTALPGGILTCITAGTSGASDPTPTVYGEFVTDGTVTWMWQKLPAPGDRFVAEIEYEIVSVTGGVLVQMETALMRANTADGERYGSAISPFADRSATPGTGVPGLWMPRKGVITSPVITLTNPGVNLRHVYNDVILSFQIGGGAEINITSSSLRLIE